VKQTLSAVGADNGGFPEPPSGPVRIVSARHDACDAETRVRLPSVIPARAVRRLRCAGCEETYETESVEELGVSEPERRRRLPLPSLPSPPKVWRFASIPIAALAVVAGLMLLQRAEQGTSAPISDQLSAGTAPATPGVAAAANAATASGQAELMRGSSFSVALPAGWERVQPQGDATFAAVASDGDADATLWIERDPSLDFTRFESRSLDQLRALAGSARVVDRTLGPTPEASVFRLAASPPPGEPAFEVTGRLDGPYRFYLATTVQADASRGAIDGAELIHGSFTPEAASRAGS
jgi:hypothetical protein